MKMNEKNNKLILENVKDVKLLKDYTKAYLEWLEHDEFDEDEKEEELYNVFHSKLNVIRDEVGWTFTTWRMNNIIEAFKYMNEDFEDIAYDIIRCLKLARIIGVTDKLIRETKEDYLYNGN